MINKNPIIFFDGVCNFCNSSVLFVLKHEKTDELRFASLQSEFAQSQLREHSLDSKTFNSIVFIEDGKYYQKSTAALKIASYLKFPYGFLKYLIIVPSFIRNFVYDIISKNRYKWFGQKDSCMIPSPELKSRFID